MMATKAFEQFLYGWPLQGDSPAESPDVLALSDGIQPEEALPLRQRISLRPLLAADNQEAQAVSLVALQDPPGLDIESGRFLLARTRWQSTEPRLPIEQVVLLPGEHLLALGGDVQALLSTLDDDLPRYESAHNPLAPIEHTAQPTWTLERSHGLLQQVVRELCADDLDRLLGLLGAALTNGVQIDHFPPDGRERLRLVRALLLLLPTRARPYLTFTTQADPENPRWPQIVFAELTLDQPHTRIDWDAPQTDPALLEQPYVAYLRQSAGSNVYELAHLVHALERLAVQLLPGHDLHEGLTALVERHRTDSAVRNGETVPGEQLLGILQSDAPPTDELYMGYMKQMLRFVLTERDTAAAEWVAERMDADPELDAVLEQTLQEMLGTQPDAVYAFVRTRLRQGEAIDERWLERLHIAAEQSLQVALESGDPETLASWLTLLSREPLRYQLADILREGLLAASTRIQNHAGLAQALLTIAVKRHPDVLPQLLHDAAVLEALPDTLLEALNEHDPDALESLSESREIFLLGLARAIDSGQMSISPALMRVLWQMRQHPAKTKLPPPYRPMTLIQRAINESHCLMEGALDALLKLLLADGEDALLYEIAPVLAAQGKLADALLLAIEKSARPWEDVLTIISTLLSEGALTPQDCARMYATLLEDNEWDDALLPMAEQLARLLLQYADAQVTTGALWKLAERSERARSEQMLRVAMGRLLHELEDMVAEAALVDSVQRLRKAAAWSNGGQTRLVRWWRRYVRAQGNGSLQKLDRALDGRRGMEDMRSVVQTTVAVRRALGQRSLAEFAEDINSTYRVLQALAEGFEREGKNTLSLDHATMRGEIAARDEELPPDVRHVLATNLKELAQLITTLSDNRSRASLMRRDGTLERQLFTGEQQPQSAIDVMRWLAGYLDGMQREDEDK